MGRSGVFAPDERVELIRGVARQKSPKGKRHVLGVALAVQSLAAKLAWRAWTFVQDPLFHESWDSEPEPDLIVTSSPDPKDYVSGVARALLVIEVADSSLDYDRTIKAQLYAEAGIPEYWIVNLVDDALEAYRQPAGTKYGNVTTYGKGERLSPEAWPDVEVEVADLIPPASVEED